MSQKSTREDKSLTRDGRPPIGAHVATHDRRRAPLLWERGGCLLLLKEAVLSWKGLIWDDMVERTCCLAAAMGQREGVRHAAVGGEVWGQLARTRPDRQQDVKAIQQNPVCLTVTPGWATTHRRCNPPDCCLAPHPRADLLLSVLETCTVSQALCFFAANGFVSHS